MDSVMAIWLEKPGPLVCCRMNLTSCTMWLPLGVRGCCYDNDTTCFGR